MPLNESLPAALRKEDWETPNWLVNAIKADFPVLVDLAASFTNYVAPLFVTDIFLEATERRLVACRESLENRYAFMNPPYQRSGGTGKFVLRAIELVDKINMGLIVLVPASIGSAWFHKSVMASFNVLVFPRRFAYIEAGDDHQDPKSVARFDSVIAVRGEVTEKQLKALRKLGPVVEVRR